jgi:endoglycosylceramidase
MIEREQRALVVRLAAAGLVLALAGCGGSDDHRPAATPTAPPVATATVTDAATRPATATATATATAVLTSTDTPARTATGTPPATASHTPTETPSSTPTVSPTGTTLEHALRLPSLHGKPDGEQGGRIADAEGREVLLRGVNVNALAEYWQGGEFPTVFPLTADDADLIAAIGWNTVRLLLSWSRVEPEPGVYDEAYLDQVRDAVRLLASRGLYSIIDLHQDAWGATLVARPEETCQPDYQPALGWDGAPAWATLDENMPRCAPAGIRELSPSVSTAFANFFSDAPGPGAIGIRSRYVAMLAHLGGVFGPEPGVAGYDLMNEPNAFGAAQQNQLSALYGQALEAIRAAEQAAGSDPRLVLFEPSALWSAVGNGAPPDFPRGDDRDIVYAPHIYSGGFDGGPITAAAFTVAREEAKRFGGAPVFSGEWGSDPRRASDPSDTYFLDHQMLQDQFFIAATLWTWHESCGDPHKQGDFRAGRLPYVWGEFEVDCTTNAITGVRQNLINQLTRAYVRAAPGRLLESSYQFGNGAFTARGTAAPAGAELLAFYPSARHGEPTLTSSGLSDVRFVLTRSDNLYIVARAAGGDWSLSVP